MADVYDPNGEWVSWLEYTETWAGGFRFRTLLRRWEYVRRNG
jgi:hypothetical protein